MDFSEHLHTTGTALKRWLIAQAQDALAIGALWLVGLLMLHVPLAVLWAILGGLLQFVPAFGTMLAMLGPALTAAFSGGLERMLYVLGLYALIVAVDGFLLQPLFMKHTARVPVWASILVPLVLGFTLGFWGVLLAPPALAVFYAYRAIRQRSPRAPGHENLPPPLSGQ